VGLTLSALLAREGVAHLVIEADDGYCRGSRAICISRRSQEILGWVGADAPLVEKGLSWAGGRSHWRDTEVLHFEMPTEPTQRFAPMVNIQQFYVEEFAHRAAQSTGDLASVHWASRVAAVRPQPGSRVATVLTFETASSTEWRTPRAATAFAPDWFVDITDTLNLKLQALDAYAEEMRPWPHPRSREAVGHLAHWRGSTVGRAAAEAFVLARHIA